MKLLILEDDDNRIQKFKEHFIGCEFYITHLTDTAIDWIKTIDFDFIFLDHDLAEEHYQTWQNPSIIHENTGLVVAKFLEDNCNLNKDAKIVIHSLNPYGSQNMYRACRARNTHLIPFTQLFDRLIYETA